MSSGDALRYGDQRFERPWPLRGQPQVQAVGDFPADAKDFANRQCAFALQEIIQRFAIEQLLNSMLFNIGGVDTVAYVVVVPSLFLVEPNGRISLVITGFDKKGMEALGRRLGKEPFEPDESVPEWKAG